MAQLAFPLACGVRFGRRDWGVVLSLPHVPSWDGALWTKPSAIEAESVSGLRDDSWSWEKWPGGQWQPLRGHQLPWLQAGVSGDMKSGLTPVSVFHFLQTFQPSRQQPRSPTRPTVPGRRPFSFLVSLFYEAAPQPPPRNLRSSRPGQHRVPSQPDGELRLTHPCCICFLSAQLALGGAARDPGGWTKGTRRQRGLLKVAPIRASLLPVGLCRC